MTSKATIRLLLVDDHSMVRMGLATILSAEKDLQIVAEADDAGQAVAAYEHHRPDVTLMDVRMPGGSGVDALRRIRAEHADARVIMLTTYDLEELVFAALDGGASGYLLKSVQRTELIEAIRQVHLGLRCFPKSLDGRFADHANQKRLSPREKQTLELMRRGLTNRDISLALGISENTAKTYVKGILLKLGAADRAEAVAEGFERGLLNIGED